MSIVELAFAPWSDPQLAAQLADHATSPSPVWLWSADGSRIVWTNAVGAAVFGAADTSECADRLFEPNHPAALEIARLAATLPASGQARLERLRGFGASFGGALTCICSQVTIADAAVGVLVIGTEAAGLPLTRTPTGCLSDAKARSQSLRSTARSSLPPMKDKRGS